jgi:DNA repair exonuclease SbcCD ATPase subunit
MRRATLARMTDPRELESSLAEMDRKLRELQQELALLSRRPEQEQEPPPAPPPAPPPGSTAGAIEQAAARVAELGRRIDALTDLRKELEEATSALREEQRRAASSQPSQ